MAPYAVFVMGKSIAIQVAETSAESVMACFFPRQFSQHYKELLTEISSL